MLEGLDRGNLFVVPLDDRRRWYRYHQLFADVLRARLQDEQPDRVPVLHRRACEWYEQTGDRSEAIRHAMAGEDFGRAADLIELAIPAMRQARQEAMAHRWLGALPDELIRVRPVLSVGYAGALMVSGQIEDVEARLRDAERWLDTTDAQEGPRTRSAAMVVVDEEGYRRLPGAIAIYRAALALAIGDVAGAVTHARRVLDLVAEDDHVARGGAAGFLALTSWAGGELEPAHNSWADAKASFQMAGHVLDAIGCVIALADIEITQGRLTDAMRTYEQGLALATEHGGPALRGAADMHVGISAIFRERNALAAASEHLLTSQNLGDENGLSQNPYRSRIALAQMRRAEGDLDGALELLTEAERLYVGNFFPDVRPIAALKARVWVAQGKLSDASGWAREHGISAAEELTYVREFEHITLAKVLLAQGIHDRDDDTLAEAANLAARLLGAAKDGGRPGHAIEALVVQALAGHARGDVAGAMASLDRALALAEPEGYVRVFLDQGPRMLALLRLAAQQPDAPSYVRRLLAAGVTVEAAATVAQPLIEPLSERELEVLRLLGTDLGGPEIARELVISLSTVRTHTQNIYAKLGVSSRRAAIRRAAELDLLARTRNRQGDP